MESGARCATMVSTTPPLLSPAGRSDTGNWKESLSLWLFGLFYRLAEFTHCETHIFTPRRRSYVSTTCELTTLILPSLPVTFNVTCLTVTYLITKSYQQRLPMHSCSLPRYAMQARP